MLVKRGALIVFEGCDRAGKTTQCKKLVERMSSKGMNVKFMNFPDRETSSGKMIDDYLRNKKSIIDEGIHLLFTFNRWEAKQQMETELKAGTTIIVDRYSYSGIAYSVAKGLDFEWCRNPERGLLKPDLVVYLTLTDEVMARRGGFGEERYESTDMQKEVKKVFERMIDVPLWQVVDADKTVEDLSDELERLVIKKMQNVGNDIQTLW